MAREELTGVFFTWRGTRPAYFSHAGVGAAFTILSDPDKRSNYDRYGAEEGVTSSGGGGGGMGRRGGPTRAQHYARYEEEISPEDIFNMFFGGGGMQGGAGGVMFGRGFPPQQHRQPQQHHQQQQAGGGPRLAQLLQLLPLLLLFLFSIISMRGSGPEERLFSLSRDDAFRTERKTSLYGVTSGLPYYVREDFWTRVSTDRSLLTRVRAQDAREAARTASVLQRTCPLLLLDLQVERAVESELYSLLTNQCAAEQQRRANLEGQIAWASSAGKEKLRQRLAEAKVASCEAHERYFGGR